MKRGRGGEREGAREMELEEKIGREEVQDIHREKGGKREREGVLRERWRESVYVWGEIERQRRRDVEKGERE